MFYVITLTSLVQSEANFMNFIVYSSVFLLQLKRVMDSDSALTEDLVAYNIIPLDASSSTNAIVYFPEVWVTLFKIPNFCIFMSTYYLRKMIVRCKQQFQLWSISMACRSCLGAISFNLQGMLTCSIFCSVPLDFRSVNHVFCVVSCQDWCDSFNCTEYFWVLKQSFLYLCYVVKLYCHIY